MISRPRNHLKGVRVNVHHLVDIIHALIRKLTSDNTLIIKNFNKTKNCDYGPRTI